MRTVAVITVARSDYGILVPVLRRITTTPGLRLHLIAAGMHLSPEFGLTVREIERDGFEIADRVEMLLSSDTPEGQAKSMGLGVLGFAQAYGRQRPDIVVALGDRAEMHAAVLAALPFKIPVAHIHGGELSFGAIDDSLRHSITKLSHLHFVATEEYAARVRQMGEEPWRVVVSGAPALDNVAALVLLSREQLEAKIGLRLEPSPLLVTYHPVSLEFERAAEQADELLAALDGLEAPIVFTKPNADAGGRAVLEKIAAWVKDRPRCVLVDNLGTQAYFSLMRIAMAMVGNSSSGLIEAPSFRLPVVNIGTRQDGRCRAANVIDCPCERAAIWAAVRRALTPEFRNPLANLVNPFGTGQAAEAIVERLRTVELNDRLLRKRFHDLRPDRVQIGGGEPCSPAA
jgi:UDP-hydrolysing UDP-N-acetyl-D-glucosamine 2-epimerase